MANILKREKQVAVLKALVEGCSIRSIVRMQDVNKTTVTRLLVAAGDKAADALDELVFGVNARFVQVDEIWAYVGKKQGHLTLQDKVERPELGDAYTFVALDAETKLVITHRVGKRDGHNAHAFMNDLAERVTGRIQITSDGFEAYVNAVEEAFGADVDYAMEIKDYGGEDAGRGRYSPPKVKATKKLKVVGIPDEDRISTSFVERQNLTMRMQMRRFTRLTNAFSKKVENLRAAVALHFFHYNFCRVHDSLDGITPAMAAGLTDRVWDLGDLLDWAVSQAVAA